MSNPHSQLDAKALMAATEALAEFCDDTSPNKRMATIAIRAYLAALTATPAKEGLVTTVCRIQTGKIWGWLK